MPVQRLVWFELAALGLDVCWEAVERRAQLSDSFCRSVCDSGCSRPKALHVPKDALCELKARPASSVAQDQVPVRFIALQPDAHSRAQDLSIQSSHGLKEAELHTIAFLLVADLGHPFAHAILQRRVPHCPEIAGRGRARCGFACGPLAELQVRDSVGDVATRCLVPEQTRDLQRGAILDGERGKGVVLISVLSNLHCVAHDAACPLPEGRVTIGNATIAKPTRIKMRTRNVRRCGPLRRHKRQPLLPLATFLDKEASTTHRVPARSEMHCVPKDVGWRRLLPWRLHDEGSAAQQDLPLLRRRRLLLLLLHGFFGLRVAEHGKLLGRDRTSRNARRHGNANPLAMTSEVTRKRGTQMAMLTRWQ